MPVLPSGIEADGASVRGENLDAQRALLEEAVPNASRLPVNGCLGWSRRRLPCEAEVTGYQPGKSPLSRGQYAVTDEAKELGKDAIKERAKEILEESRKQLAEAKAKLEG